VADLLAKEVKDFAFYFIQTRYQASDLTVDRHTDALDPIQHLKHPPQSRTARRGGVPMMLFAENSSGRLPVLTHHSPKRCAHAG
jgi:hypothetical protein